MGRIIHELLATRFPMPLAEILAATIETGSWDGELIHTCKKGEQVIVESRWSVQRDANGRPIGFLEINRDVTARKQAEVALRSSELRSGLPPRRPE